MKASSLTLVVLRAVTMATIMMKTTPSATVCDSGPFRITRRITAVAAHLTLAFTTWLAVGLVPASEARAVGLWAGVTKVDITNTKAGPVDPEIGILRLDRKDGRTLAIVYNFACHPIQGVSSGGNSADIIGFASRVIEDNLSDGTIALFLQGCAGDVNPVFYKDVNHPRDSEPLGNKLGLSTLKALRKIPSSEDSRLKVIQQVIALPRADVEKRIVEMEAERQKLLRSLTGTYLNLKTFIALYLKHHLSSEFPSYDAHDYLHQQRMGPDDLKKLDATNRRRLQQYIRNIHTMEQLTRINTNLALLRKHQGEFIQSDKRTINVHSGQNKSGISS